MNAHDWNRAFLNHANTHDWEALFNNRTRYRRLRGCALYSIIVCNRRLRHIIKVNKSHAAFMEGFICA